MVHRREIGGVAVVFGNHGALFGNAMTWWDHPTGSIWSQPLGQAFAGPLSGTRLELLPSTLTSWSAWRSTHPETTALQAQAGRSGFELDQMLIAVDVAGEAAGYPVTDVRAHGVIEDVVAGLPIAVLVDPRDEDRWAVLVRNLEAPPPRGSTLSTEAPDPHLDATVAVHLEVVGDEIRDRETGSVWDPLRGRAIAGPLEGRVLAHLASFTVFPADFRTFWPDGRIWPER